jgi:trigger factor
MPKIVREDVDNLNAVLSITLEKADYEPRWNTELQKYRQKASFKGFRKGKTPKRVLKRLVGKSVLGEIVNDLIQEELINYLTQDDIHLLGQPLPSKEQEPLDFDLDELQDYEFKFDLGLSPEFEVQGISAETTMEKYLVNIPDEQVDEELDAARRRLGERVYPEEVQDGDFLKLSVKELEDGVIKEGGQESEFSLLVESIAEDTVKDVMIGKQLGDTLPLNLLTLEKDRDEAYIRKYYLNMAEDEEAEIAQEYEATIEEISRIELAELNEDFYNKYFGEGNVSSEEDAREKIREFIRGRFDREAEGLLFRDLQDLLMKENQIDLPDAFLKRWLGATNETLSEEDVEKAYEGFTKTLRWSLVRNKLVQRFQLSVDKAEVEHAFKMQIMSYMGNSPYANEEFLKSMTQRMMEDEKQYNQVMDGLLDDKLFEAMAKEITIQENPIEIEAFEKVIQDARVEAMKARGEINEEE